MNPQLSLLAFGCLMFATAHAGGADKHSATLSVQGDGLDNRHWLGILAMSLGQGAWVQGSFGRSDFAAAEAGDRQLAGAAVGVSGRALSATVELMQVTGEEHFKQRTWVAALNWRGARGGLGVDALTRSSSVESTTTTQAGGMFAAPMVTVSKESADGTGFGLHGDLDLTARANAFVGIIRYRYDFKVHSDATGSASPLSSLLQTAAIPPGVWRDQNFIERSYRIGGTYRLEQATLAAQYVRDYAARSDATLSTLQVHADVPVTEHWLLSPTLGYSRSEGSDTTGFGGLSLSLRW